MEPDMEEVHEDTIGLEEGANVFVNECASVCLEVDGELKIEWLLGMIYEILLQDQDLYKIPSQVEQEMERTMGEHIGFALRVGMAIGQLQAKEKP
jgi:hypothetical protein